MGPLKCCGNGTQNTVNQIKTYTDNLNNHSTESITMHMINFSLPKQKKKVNRGLRF